jgi:Holliday junction resolvase RusA-like endonuclease
MKNAKDGNRNTATDADLESNIGDAALRANEAPAFTAPCRVTFHHIRKRLADIDGISGKAVIDGLVQAGIFANDTTKQVAEIRNCQSKGDREETRIVIEVVEADD